MNSRLNSAKEIPPSDGSVASSRRTACTSHAKHTEMNMSITMNIISTGTSREACCLTKARYTSRQKCELL